MSLEQAKIYDALSCLRLYYFWHVYVHIPFIMHDIHALPAIIINEKVVFKSNIPTRAITVFST